MSKENKATLTTAHKVTQSDSRLIEKGVFFCFFFLFFVPAPSVCPFIPADRLKR